MSYLYIESNAFLLLSSSIIKYYTWTLIMLKQFYISHAKFNKIQAGVTKQ